MKAVCFLDYLVLCVCIYGVRGGMDDMELLGGRGRGVMVLVLLRLPLRTIGHKAGHYCHF